MLKNGKDLSNAAPKIKLWNHTKKTHFPVFAKNFRRPCMKLKNFFCQFPNPWTLRVSGMGGYTSKCEKKSKSLHPNGQTHTKMHLVGRIKGNYGMHRQFAQQFFHPCFTPLILCWKKTMRRSIHQYLDPLIWVLTLNHKIIRLQKLIIKYILRDQVLLLVLKF